MKKILKALQFRLQKRRMKHLSGDRPFRDKFGNELLLDLDQYIDCRVYLEGTYEDDTIQEIGQQMSQYKIDTFIDIGANSGFVSLGVSRLLALKELWLFEPDPKTHSRLVKNLELNQDRLSKISRIEVKNCALSNRETRALLHRSEEPRAFDSAKKNSGTNSLNYNSIRHDQSVDVSVSCLDGFQILSPCLLKIDVEGHELSVLEGARELLGQGECMVFVEALGEKFTAVEALLLDLDYKLLKALDGENYLFKGPALPS